MIFSLSTRARSALGSLNHRLPIPMLNLVKLGPTWSGMRPPIPPDLHLSVPSGFFTTSSAGTGLVAIQSKGKCPWPLIPPPASTCVDTWRPRRGPAVVGDPVINHAAGRLLPLVELVVVELDLDDSGRRVLLGCRGACVYVLPIHWPIHWADTSGSPIVSVIPTPSAPCGARPG